MCTFFHGYRKPISKHCSILGGSPPWPSARHWRYTHTATGMRINCIYTSACVSALHNVDSYFPGAAGNHVDIVPHTCMQLYGGALDPSATPQELRREVIGQVEREVRERNHLHIYVVHVQCSWSQVVGLHDHPVLITYIQCAKIVGKAWIIFRTDPEVGGACFCASSSWSLGYMYIYVYSIWV